MFDFAVREAKGGSAEDSEFSWSEYNRINAEWQKELNAPDKLQKLISELAQINAITNDRERVVEIVSVFRDKELPHWVKPDADSEKRLDVIKKSMGGGDATLIPIRPDIGKEELLQKIETRIQMLRDKYSLNISETVLEVQDDSGNSFFAVVGAGTTARLWNALGKAECVEGKAEEIAKQQAVAALLQSQEPTAEELLDLQKTQQTAHNMSGAVNARGEGASAIIADNVSSINMPNAAGRASAGIGRVLTGIVR